MFKKTKEKAEVTEISTLQLKELLTTLSKTPDVSFRYRRNNEMWIKHFTYVNTVSDKDVLLYNDVEGRHINVHINDIVQFEIDRKLNGYQPFFHYQVQPSTA